MKFDLKLYHPSEGVTRTTCTAANEAGARLFAAEQGRTVLSARRVWLALDTRAGGKFKVQLFAQELLALVDAGMGLVEALSILADKARDPVSRTVIQGVRELLNQGHTLSRALGAHPAVFPTMFVATVKASEQTGDLQVALRRYLAYQQQLNSVRDKIVAASIYPLLLLVVGLLVIVFLLAYVVPRFGRVYADLGQSDLPAVSRLLMSWGQLVSENGSTLLASIGLLAIAAAYAFTRKKVRAALSRLFWRLPRLGEQIRIYQLARFTRTVAMLIQGGVPLVTALDMTDQLLQQPALREGLLGARTAIREGGGLAESFRVNGLATDVGIRLLVVGERGGNLGHTMERIAAFYDDEISHSVEWFSRLFEPLLMMVIGCLIGGIVILMYLPIFDLVGSVK